MTQPEIPLSNILIVESPNKARHIKEFLDSSWTILASRGHIRDLYKSGEESYVRPPDFRLNYTIMDDKKSVVSALKAAVKGNDVYLATDPDREGEAISWHICEVCHLDPKKVKRITYHEVTESAVKKAISQPRLIDLKLVEAQEARRALDRIVGWEVSGPLSGWVSERASAGRVQTPALRIIVEREAEIDAFKPTKYMVIFADMGDWRLQWEDGLKEGEYFNDQVVADNLVSRLNAHEDMRIIESKSVNSKSGPPPPLITSSMQSVGSTRLKVGIPEIMKAAQSLFESGKITYHRTDDPNIGDEGLQLLRDYLTSKDIKNFNGLRKWKAKENAQEGHECIRPTDFAVENVDGSSTESGLYRLIWLRAVASQMEDAEIKRNTVVASMGDDVFKASGSVVVYNGWKDLYDDEAESDGSPKVPVLEKNSIINADKGVIEYKSTKPPKKYTEASLVSALEQHGVGRPSTYASIIQVLYNRGYMTAKAQTLTPTQLGKKVVAALLDFDFADLSYTSEIEDALDAISKGQQDYLSVVSVAYEDIHSVLGTRPVRDMSTPCPVDGCTGSITRHQSKNKPGLFFWVCSKPDDSHKFLPDNSGEPVWPIPERPTSACPVAGCGGEAKRFKSKSGDYFWICDKGKDTHGFLKDVGGRPEYVSVEEEKSDVKCPKCSDSLTIRKTSGGHEYFYCRAKHGPWWVDKAGGVGKMWTKKR